jgi:hypothetical protein
MGKEDNWVQWGIKDESDISPGLTVLAVKTMDADNKGERNWAG